MAKEAAGVKVGQSVQYLERIQVQKTELVKDEEGKEVVRFLQDEEGRPVLEDGSPELRAALVTKVHSEKVVNLVFFGEKSGINFLTSVELGEGVGQFRVI